MWDKIDYSDKCLNEMIAMTVENYGIDNEISNYEFIDYEYFQNPAGNADIALAYDKENQKLAGQYVVLPKKVHVLGEDYLCILSLNTLTREAYRGQKIFTSLAEEVYNENIKKGTKFCYGAPNPNSHYGFINKLNFRDIGSVPLYLKLLKPTRLVLEKIKKKKAISTINLDKFISSVTENSSISEMEYSIISINETNIDQMDMFWDKISDKYPVIMNRNSETILWRYVKIPIRKYQIFMIIKNGRQLAYCITRIMDVAGITCGMIVDFLFLRNEMEAGKILIRCVSKALKENGVNLSGCLMKKDAEEAEILKKNGFFICPKLLEPQPFSIIFRQFNSIQNADKVISDFKNWFFTMGDYDVI